MFIVWTNLSDHVFTNKHILYLQVAMYDRVRFYGM